MCLNAHIPRWIHYDSGITGPHSFLKTDDNDWSMQFIYQLLRMACGSPCSYTNCTKHCTTSREYSEPPWFQMSTLNTCPQEHPFYHQLRVTISFGPGNKPTKSFLIHCLTQKQKDAKSEDSAYAEYQINYSTAITIDLRVGQDQDCAWDNVWEIQSRSFRNFAWSTEKHKTCHVFSWNTRLTVQSNRW